MAQHPLDADRAGATADIPQQLATPRRQRCHGDGAYFRLGDLPVMLETMFRQPGRERDDGGVGLSDHFDRQHVQGMHILQIKIIGPGLAVALLRAAKGLEHMQPRPAKPFRHEDGGDLRRRACIGGQSEHARAGLQQPRNQRLRPPTKRDRVAVLQRPAQPGTGQRKGGGLRDAEHFGGIDIARQHRPDPEPAGIARGKHGDGVRPCRQDFWQAGFDRAGPGESLAADQGGGMRQMPARAGDQNGLGDGRAGGWRKPIDPILADPHDSQPGPVHAFSPA